MEDETQRVEASLRRLRLWTFAMWAPWVLFLPVFSLLDRFGALENGNGTVIFLIYSVFWIGSFFFCGSKCTCPNCGNYFYSRPLKSGFGTFTNTFTIWCVNCGLCLFGKATPPRIPSPPKDGGTGSGP